MLVVQQELAIYVLMLGLDDEHPHFLRTAAGAPRYSRQLAGYVTELDIFELFCINNSLSCMQIKIRDFSNLNLKYRNSQDGIEYTYRT